MHALIDGDLVAYINAASAEHDGPEIAVIRADKYIRDILLDVGATTYKIFLSGGNNFRYEVNPLYKANRTQEKPAWLDVCREYLATEWKASVTDGYEADDALGMEQTEASIICSIDKDLLMIPGNHFSWELIRSGNVVKPKTFTKVTPEEGIKHFYKQMLIGDKADNVIGIDGIGKVKADKLISPCTTELEMVNVVGNLYANPERYMMNADCLWIWQKEGERYSHRKVD